MLGSYVDEALTSTCEFPFMDVYKRVSELRASSSTSFAAIQLSSCFRWESVSSVSRVESSFLDVSMTFSLPDNEVFPKISNQDFAHLENFSFSAMVMDGCFAMPLAAIRLSEVAWGCLCVAGVGSGLPFGGE